MILIGRTTSVIVLAVLSLSGCRGGSNESLDSAIGGDPDEGKRVIRQAGCASCHSVPGVRGARGRVGPPLDFFAERAFIAGQIPNTPENLMRWVMDPHSVEKGTAMPDVGLSEKQARDVVAYLYTLH